MVFSCTNIDPCLLPGRLRQLPDQEHRADDHGNERAQLSEYTDGERDVLQLRAIGSEHHGDNTGCLEHRSPMPHCARCAVVDCKFVTGLPVVSFRDVHISPNAD